MVTDVTRPLGQIFLIPIRIPSKGEAIDLLLRLRAPLRERFGCRAAIGKPVLDISWAFKASRGQYLSTIILERLGREAPAEAVKLLGVADVDLFVPHLNFVFGEAQMSGRLALISLYRLRPRPLRTGKRDGSLEYLFFERTLKEATHELGHTFGLDHCRDPGCVMFFSNSLLDTDRKGSCFCPSCRSGLS